MIVAVDFDGTVEHKFPLVGEDVPGAVTTLQNLVQAGHKLILWTIRADGSPTHPNCLQEAISWYKDRNIPLWGVNANPSQKYWSKSPKAHADIFIDDMAIGAPLRHGCIDWTEVGAELYKRGYLV